MGKANDKGGLRKVFTLELLVLCIFCTLPEAALSVGPRSEGRDPAANYPLAQCHTLTLQRGQYSLENDTIRLTNNKDVTIALDDAVIGGDGTVHACFPLSDSFQTCSKKTIPPSGFQLQPSFTLAEQPSGHQWLLGDYDIQPNGSALVCAAPPKRRRRCNYLVLQSNEYAVHPDGALWIAPMNKTLANANFVIEIATQAANVCYPLTPEFLNCSKWLLQSYEFTISSNLSLVETIRAQVWGPGDYVVLHSSRAVVCITGKIPPIDVHSFDINTLHTVAQLFSAICLLAAIIIHLILPDLSYQRAPLLCQAFSLMITFICLSARKMQRGIETAGCYVLFYMTYYFCLAAFCWLTVLAFDIWRISVHLSAGTKGYHWVNYFLNKKFLFYALFGWGVPILFMILLAVVDAHEHIQQELGLFPMIQHMCWFNERASAYTFFFGPMCTLLAVNFVFFGLSVHNIWKASHNAEFTNTKLNKQLLVICFIVFLAMGLFWIMEIVSYSTLSHGIIWIVPDLINASQGVIIAAVYTCRPLTIRSLREKFCHRQSNKQ